MQARNQNQIDVALLSYNIGSIYYVNKDKEKTLKYLKESVTVSKAKMNIYDRAFF